MGCSSERHFFRSKGAVVESERLHGGGGPGLGLETLVGLSEVGCSQSWWHVGKHCCLVPPPESQISLIWCALGYWEF